MRKRSINPDNAPLRLWLSYTPAVLSERLENNGLTADSVLSDGTTLGEKACEILFGEYGQLDGGRGTADRKFRRLLDTCADRNSTAAIWLRISLRELDGAQLSEMMGLLVEALEKKLTTTAPDALLPWGIATLRAARDCVSMSIQHAGKHANQAIERYLETVWKTLPESMLYEGKPLVPCDGDNTHAMGRQFHLLSLRVQEGMRNPSGAMSSQMLPLQLWNLTTTYEMCLSDQRIANANWGLVEHKYIGHAPFATALREGVKWPEDPRVDPCIDYLLSVGSAISPLMAGQALQKQTPKVAKPSNGARL